MLVQRRPRNPFLLVFTIFFGAIGLLLITSLTFAFLIPPEFHGYSLIAWPAAAILLTVVVCMVTGN